MPTFIAHYSSPIGTLEVAASAQCLLSILFLETARRPGPGRVPTVEGSAALALAMQQLDEYFTGTRHSSDLPMDLQGTPFQRKVWAALTNIPYGFQTINGWMVLHLAIVK